VEGFWAALRVIAATGLVVASAAWTARYLGRRHTAGSRGRHLAVLETLGLGQQRTLVAVRAGAGGRVLILGAGRDGVSLLADMGADEFMGLGDASADQAGGRDNTAGATTGAATSTGSGDPLLQMLQGRIGDLQRRLGQRSGDGPARGER